MVEKSMKRAMKSKLKFSLTFALITILLWNVLAILPVNAIDTPTIYLISSNVSSHLKWKVTAQVKEIPNINATSAYQVVLIFNTLFLECIGAWIPKPDGDWIFSGLNTVSIAPTIDNERGFVLVGDAIVIGTSVSGSGPFSLAVFEFLIKNPLDTDPLSYINLSGPDTYLLNDSLEELSPIIKTNACTSSIWSHTSTQATSADSTNSEIDAGVGVSKLSDYVNGRSVELIVGLDDKVPYGYGELTSIAKKYEGNIKNKVLIRGKIIAAVVDITLEKAHSFAAKVSDSSFASYVEPNHRFKTFTVPNDPYWQDQWGLKMIQADWAWNTTRGDPSVVVAVIDTGVDWNHSDLVANIWNNTDEVVDGIDNDGNGYIDDVRGWDFVDTTSPVWPGEDGTVRDNDPMDFHGHGTHCSGIAAAVTNNSIGVAGVSWRSKIMPVRAGYKDPGGYGCLEYDDTVEAIIYAVDNGADIISMSWGGYVDMGLEKRAIEYANDKGVLLVAAAGNEAWSVQSYPASYEEVVAVAATDEDDNLASFSNYGQWIELSAPGVNIISTLPNNSYESWDGTSMATPHISGLAALIWSQHPNMTRDEVRYLLRLTADDLGGSGFDEIYGWGRVNASRAIEESQPQHDLAILSWSKPSLVLPGQAVGVNTEVLNFGTSDEINITVELIANGTTVDNDQVSLFSNGTTVTFNTTWTPSSQGVYNITLSVVAVNGETRVENNVVSAFVTARNPTILYVPQNYTTIQSAIDAAMPLDIIRVSSGTYSERLVVNKPQISIVGENKGTTVIDGRFQYAEVVSVLEERITITGFTIQNSSLWGRLVSLMWSKGNNITDNIIKKGYEGIVSIYDRGDNHICGNTIMETDYGISMHGGGGNKIYKNHIIGDHDRHGIDIFGGYDTEIFDNKVAYFRNGIVLWLYAIGVRIEGNFIKDNKYGLWLNNVIDHAVYHNTFNLNLYPENVLNSEDIRWSGRWNVTGNYWSDYTGNNTDGDPYMIGDTDLPHRGYDYYPLMNPFLPGDVIHDGKVDIRDIARVAKAYGSHGPPNESEDWDPHADLNEDRFVDDLDLDIVAPNFGKTWQAYWGE